ncbi:unnamed protein product [Brassica rapa]|uniref:Uncharacterized protein n=1 Tax=Brassica campestris TaxID=3711 RepID=A0A3P6AFZ2_BRACM|nr:unnamed protein product [Brassica rapa]CAG7885053.1 unnamed protein product [Brassica rapa]VDC84090.1 unnamed protein product [Brassica rapa]
MSLTLDLVSFVESKGGKFVLRIEDTDLEISKRSCCSSRGLVLIVMKVLGLVETLVLTRQSERNALYFNSVMDVRQFLLDAPETCYFTHYELLFLLYTKNVLDGFDDEVVEEKGGKDGELLADAIE